MKYQKQFLLVSAAIVIFLLSACSDNGSSAKDVFVASEVCPENMRGTFTDPRDGQTYKYTTIGGRVWMAENLNYDDGAGGSSCAV